jgi:uncharacterized membrane protein HdeD (DUF308 family)
MTTATANKYVAAQRTSPWWLVLIEGIALLIIGVLFLINPAQTTVIATMVLGIYWLVQGVLSIVSIFINSSGWLWKLIMGILGIIAGIIILQHPLLSPLVVGATLVIVLGIQGIFMGILQIILALQGGGWGLAILGVISIIIGGILLFNVWVATISLPLVIGIFAIIGGILAIIQAFRER